MLISVIVPVYNVEKYLDQCIKSILNQSFSDYEVILVDDGSKDASGQMCDVYAKQYTNIKVLHKENGGLSDARNAGIKMAQGEYLLFVDSDDYIGEDSISEIVSVLDAQEQKVDLVFLEATKVFPDGRVEPLGDGYKANHINGKSKTEVLRHIASLPKYPAAAWSKLTRRELIVQNELYFTKGLLSEDLDWTMGLLTTAEKFAYCHVPYYFYRQARKGSISNTASIRNFCDIVYTLNKWTSPNMEKPYQEYINRCLSYEYLMLLLMYNRFTGEDKKLAKMYLEEYAWLMKWPGGKKTRLFGLMFRVVGIENSVRVLGYIRRCLSNKNKKYKESVE